MVTRPRWATLEGTEFFLDPPVVIYAPSGRGDYRPYAKLIGYSSLGYPGYYLDGMPGKYYFLDQVFIMIVGGVMQESMRLRQHDAITRDMTGAEKAARQRQFFALAYELAAQGEVELSASLEPVSYLDR